MPTILLSGCAILKEKKLLLIRKKDKELWELPGGTVSSKADMEQVAAEKTKEQIGIDPTIIQQFTILEYQKNEKNIEATIFECDISDDSKPVAGENIEEVKWFPVSSLSKEKIGEDVKSILEEL
jgi:ADP-ribose pyrophosphatase YjhB (NUDIX family)